MGINLKEFVKDGESSLILCGKSDEFSIGSEGVVCVKEENKVADLEASSFDTVIINKLEDYSSEILTKLLKITKPGGKLVINREPGQINSGDVQSKLELDLKIKGFMNVTVSNNIVTCSKPKYEVGSAVKLNLKKPASNVWKLPDNDDDETIDPDELLDDDDLKKPDASTLKVCGTTGKRKACKNCSCGLAEELDLEAQKGKVIDTSNVPKSSCGNCYLGDAFRCASCPYLGMPAFKPGEKIQLSDDLLKSDL